MQTTSLPILNPLLIQIGNNQNKQKNEHRDLANQTTDIPFQKKTYEIQTQFLYFIKEKQQQMLFYVSYIY